METIRFPNRLKKHRDIQGYTQKQIAFMLGFKNAARIGQWEKGLALPSIINLLKLSVIYSAFINDFYIDLLQEYKPHIIQKKETLSAETKP
ncbi:MAG: helix-turn-helix transcriptional regulator [Bacteroidota bacterium]|nr:helix-turn-helix transcriptional regulator [Bacteroidota bacterium]